MSLPSNVRLNKVSDFTVEVHGWASDPFSMTESSAKKSLERVRSRKAQYEPDVYERNISLYTEVFALMGWSYPEEPQSAPEVQSEPEKPAIQPPAEPQAAPEVQPGASTDTPAS